MNSWQYRYATGWINRSDWTNVHLGSDTTKNADSNVAHNLNTPLSNLLVKLFISTDGTDATSFEVIGLDSAIWGYTVSYIDNNNIKIQISTNGILYIIDNGTLVSINTEDWYYKIKVWFAG